MLSLCLLATKQILWKKGNDLLLLLLYIRDNINCPLFCFIFQLVRLLKTQSLSLKAGSVSVSVRSMVRNHLDHSSISP